jgi:3-isopropylmalate/(R)-2-methylmalate dehydratase large subunit
MGMTMTEKILARAAGRARVEPGENVWVRVDVLMTHDVCGPGTIGIWREKFGPNARVWDPERVVIIPDHYIFTADAKARRNIEILRAFAQEQGIRYFYDVGTERYKGVCHVALAEEGHTRPGEVLLGTDSHTCTAGAFGEFATGIGNTDAGFVLGTGRLWLKVPPTMRFVFEGDLPPYLMAKDLILQIIGDIGVDGATYRAMEFAGDAIYQLGRIAAECDHPANVEERMTLCNMVVEAGGKNGIIAPDETILEYVRERTERSGTRREFEPVANDPDATFWSERVYDVSRMEPLVAKPHSPDHRATVREVAGTKLDRAYIGSCTGGKITDFIAAAKVLKGKEVRIDTFIVPATTEIQRGLDRFRVDGQTLRDIFEAAGCIVGPASCAACLGGPLDTLGRLNEPLVCISSTNRNFPGRMGHKEAQIYLASPLTVAASAVRGVITDPREEMA